MVYIKFFEEVGINDISLVGGKNASLGEMINNLAPHGIKVPSGFAITADGYRLHINKNDLANKINSLLAQVSKNRLDDLAKIGKEIRALIKNAPLPHELSTEIAAAYHTIEQRYGAKCDVAVRSSATAEDLPEASFAGQQETYLNISGVEELLGIITQGYASLFTDRAISYRIDHGFEHAEVALSLGVQKMVRSDKASAGVIFTLDTESGFRDVIFITGSYGLGELVVQGSVNPDEFYVHKPTLTQGFNALLKKRMGSKESQLIYGESAQQATQLIKVPKELADTWVLSNAEVLQLAHHALVIENYYSAKKGAWTPMDIEWAKDGVDGQLYIVQARPETVHAHQQDKLTLSEYTLSRGNKAKILCRGKSIGQKIVNGKAIVVKDASLLASVNPGDIIVTDMTDPDWEPVMKIAGGIVTNRGGRTCHAAIISRELGIPAIVGTTHGTEKIADGSAVTLDCSSGEVGIVYEGIVPFSVETIELGELKKPKVDLLMNVANPDEAFNLAKLPNNGIGLARLEFIINSSIKIHPMALVHPEKVLDPEVHNKINAITKEHADKKQFFIDTLAQEAGTIAAAFFPKPVIMRMSDFKSNEYRDLSGGEFFEPEEENPMIGFRGASRYYHPDYAEAFALECAAMKKIREEMGLVNVKLMLPFVRTVAEASHVIDLMAAKGLKRGAHGLELYMMCEIPSNVLLIDKFAELFDGFSIGSNDLTQLTLAVDRDSALVASVFDERDEAVKKMLSMAIQGAKAAHKKIGICGQAPSDFPEVADFLIELGIDSLSLNPDSIVKMHQRLAR